MTDGILGSASSYRDNFTDLNSLDAVKKMGRAGDQQALREVARQFEAMFLQQMLKTMRSTEDVFAEGNFTQSNEMKFHRDLMDQQMSLEMTKGRGMGLAEALFEQMKSQYGKLLPVGSDIAGSDHASARANPPASQSFSRSSPAVASIGGAAPPDVSVAERIAGFVDQVYDHAVVAAEKLGVAVDGIVAQAALETGWGQHILKDKHGASSFNLFNIKAGPEWRGATVAKDVDEFKAGQVEKEHAVFRAYDSIESAFADFTTFLQGRDRYRDVAGKNTVDGYASALQSAGFATDPAYTQKINRIANTPAFKHLLARKLL